jgi:apolipoprotein N-acyltransferase
MKEPPKDEEQWDKKKILLFLIAAIVLIGIGFEAKSLFLGANVSPSAPVSIQKPDVKGAATQVSSNIKNSVQNQLDNLKSEAQNVDLVEIASSSPQVQKVINDLKAIQDYPKNQLKTTCQQICNGL